MEEITNLKSYGAAKNKNSGQYYDLFSQQFVKGECNFASIDPEPANGAYKSCAPKTCRIYKVAMIQPKKYQQRHPQQSAQVDPYPQMSQGGVIVGTKYTNCSDDDEDGRQLLKELNQNISRSEAKRRVKRNKKRGQMGNYPVEGQGTWLHNGAGNATMGPDLSMFRRQSF